MILIYRNSLRETSRAAGEAMEILGKAGFDSAYYESGSFQKKEYRLAVAFGGDGTMLRLARMLAGTGTPIIGVNLGSRGFLTELEPDELAALPEIASGSFIPEPRMMLQADLIREDTVIHKDFALNDCVVKGIVKVIDIQVKCDDVTIQRVIGDGVIISTPTGSTAYNLAAGGPIVEPSARNIIITQICPHTLGVKPIILSPDRIIETSLCGTKVSETVLSVDGGDSVELKLGDTLRVSCSDETALFAHLSHKDFYKRVSDKLR